MQWADSKSCPALNGIVADLQKLTLPRPDVPTVGHSQAFPTTDGVIIELRVDAAYGSQMADLRIASNLGTPLAEWSVESPKKLSSCWTKDAPKI